MTRAHRIGYTLGFTKVAEGLGGPESLSWQLRAAPYLGGPVRIAGGALASTAPEFEGLNPNAIAGFLTERSRLGFAPGVMGGAKPGAGVGALLGGLGGGLAGLRGSAANNRDTAQQIITALVGAGLGAGAGGVMGGLTGAAIGSMRGQAGSMREGIGELRQMQQLEESLRNQHGN